MPDHRESWTAEWLRCMRAGDFDGAWAMSDRLLHHARTEAEWTKPRHYQRIWDGDSIDGRRVLVRCYHGLGDTIQFIRYAPMLRRRAREVIVWAPRTLIPLLERAAGIDRLLPLHDGTPDVDYDVDVEIMELPYLFRTNVQTIPNDVPYLQVDPLDVGSAPEPHVALVWIAGDWNAQRSIPSGDIRPLLAMQGIQWHRVHRYANGWANLGRGPLLDLARGLASMDLVISVDTVTAHLAGALGVPTWVLLPLDADWRWMTGRSDSPWYPRTVLFRQQRLGCWDDVIARVCRALTRFPATAPADSIGTS